MIARDNVILLTTRWPDAKRDRVISRMRIAGDELVYRDKEGLASIDGPGTLLVEDYRAQADAKPVDKKGVPFAGDGATAFSWLRRMSLQQQRDKGTSVASLEGTVYMKHQGTGRDETVEMKADRLEATFQAAAAEPVPAPEKADPADPVRIDRVLATGGIDLRLTRPGPEGQRAITADRLEYDAKEHTILLTALPDRRVLVEDPQRPKPLRSGAILWRLNTDELELREPNF